MPVMKMSAAFKRRTHEAQAPAHGNGEVVSLDDQRTKAHLRHKWGELIAENGMAVLIHAMKLCGASAKQANVVVREGESHTVSSLDPLANADEWIESQLHSVETTRKIMALAAQGLQAMRENAPNLPGRPLAIAPSVERCSAAPQWLESPERTPALVWRDLKGLQWAAVPNPLSLEVMRWLIHDCGTSQVWLQCLSAELERKRPKRAMAVERVPALDGRDRVISWLAESQAIGGVSDIHMYIQRTDGGPVGRVLYRQYGQVVKELPDISLEHFLSAQRALLTLSERTEGDTPYETYDKQILLPIGNGEKFTGRLNMVPYRHEDNGETWYTTAIRVLASDTQQARTIKEVVGEHDIKRAHDLLDINSGLVIVSGPTGSGKTTLLASLLSAVYVERPGQRLITVEDPIEIYISGAVQIEVREQQGLTFAKILQSLLRQDPDVLLVGEVRDPEVAQIALRVGVSGHTVYTTIHAPFATTVAMRMTTLEIPPDQLAATLRRSTSQRLLTGSCPKCSPTRPIEKEPQYEALAQAIKQATGLTTLPDVIIEQPQGDPACPACEGEYAPRRLLFETLDWSALPTSAFHKAESHWWNEALTAGRLVPMWYRACAKLLRREISCSAFLNSNSFGSQPPYLERQGAEVNSLLREALLEEAQL